jgi:hypothetical protein
MVMAAAAPQPAPAGFTAAALRAEFGRERKAVVLERAGRHVDLTDGARRHDHEVALAS